jgi:hypothetical protein
LLQHIESLIAEIDAAERTEKESPQDGSNRSIIHRFDTERRDLEKCGHVLELHERRGTLLLVAARSNVAHVTDAGREQVRIDSAWALEILSGGMSPLAALEQRLGRPRTLENIRSVVGERQLRRIDTRVTSAHYLAGEAASSFQMS